jgi:hypothetical protein
MRPMGCFSLQAFLSSAEGANLRRCAYSFFFELLPLSNPPAGGFMEKIDYFKIIKFHLL